MEIVLMVAVADNGVIGAGGAIPWRLKTDQQRLKAMTMNRPVVMGRKTFASLRRPLPGRTNIVVTRDPEFRAAGVVVTSTPVKAMAIATGDALRRFATEIAVNVTNTSIDNMMIGYDMAILADNESSAISSYQLTRFWVV